MTKTSRTTNSVQVGVRLAREVEVDDHIDRNDINTTGKDIGRDETTGFSALEVVENPTQNYNTIRV